MKTKLELNKVIALSKEESKSLTDTAMKYAKDKFIALEKWRNKSVQSEFRF